MFEAVLKSVVGIVVVFVKTVFVVVASVAFCVFVLVIGNDIGVVVNGCFVFVVDVVVVDVSGLGIVGIVGEAVAVVRFCSVVVGFGFIVKCFNDVSALVIGKIGDCVTFVSICVVL